MPAYVTGHHETEVNDVEDSEKVTMTIESTNIRNTGEPHLTYIYKVFVLLPTSSKPKQIYKSRQTILDRPCWRDDTVTLYNCRSRHNIEIYSFADADSGLNLVDTLELEPVIKIRDAFKTTNEKTMQIASKHAGGYSYTLCVGWTTPDYLKHVEGLERKK